MSDYDRVYKILIIDDDKTLQMMLKTVLISHEFDVVSTFSGEEGLLLAKSEKELNEQDARTRAKYPDAPKTNIYYGGLPADLKL